MRSGGKGGSIVSSICTEPFRLFFPTGLAASVLGVSLWPLWYGGVIVSPPHVPHARLMIEGFFGAFFLGFMGTALPRMMSAPRLTVLEIGVSYLIYLGMVLSHLTGNLVLGESCFLVLLAGFLTCMGVRLVRCRRDVPPPGFVLAGMGLCGAAAGAALFLQGQFNPVSPFQHTFASLLLNQGFVLFPILGIGGFLFPRFVGAKNAQDFPESVSPPPGWNAKAMRAGICGLLLFISFWLEAAGSVVEGRLLRGFVAATYVLMEVPVFRATNARGTLAFGLRTGMVFVLVGVFVAAASPMHQKGLDHLLFVSGFGLVALTVASRVVLGHSGRIEFAEGRVRRMHVILWLLVVGALTRASAEFWPRITVSHHIYAALCWAAAAVIWAVWLFPRLRESEEE